MTVRVNGGKVLVRDRNAPVKARGSFCERRSRHAVRCRAPDTDGLVRISLDKRNDRLSMSIRNSFATLSIRGGRGHDRIVSRDIYAGIHGDRGDDVIRAGRGGGNLVGGRGDDRIHGGRGADVLEGGPGDDVLHGERGKDSLDGGLPPGLGERRPAGHDRLHGGAGDDGLDDNDDDRRVSIGRDKLVGGYGTDHVSSYFDRQKPVSVNLRRGGGDGQKGERDVLRRVESVLGGDGDDRLIGDGDENLLDGRGGDDVVRGRGGNDLIDALHDDRVTGDYGNDLISTAASSTARVRCGVGNDLVVSNPGQADQGADVGAGPHLASNCDLLEGRNRDANFDLSSFTLDPSPSPMSASGDLTFTLVEFDCCEHNFTLTRPTSPFEELDSTKANRDEVTVTAPPDVVADAESGPVTLRAVTFDKHGPRPGDNVQPLVWRFNASRSD